MGALPWPFGTRMGSSSLTAHHSIPSEKGGVSLPGIRETAGSPLKDDIRGRLASGNEETEIPAPTSLVLPPSPRQGHGWIISPRKQGLVGGGMDFHLNTIPSTDNSPSEIPQDKAGQVVTVEPGLYYPEIGGVRLEDVVLVTQTGHKNLTKFEKVLEL